MANKVQESGVQELIDRLRDEGVQEGKQRADEIVQKARAEARGIVAEAERQAEEISRRAQADAERLQSAGKDALRIAARDTILTLKSDLAALFSNQVRELVSTAMVDEAFLQKLIHEVAGRVMQDERDAESGGPTAEIILPRDIVGVDDLRRKPEEVREGTLSHFVLQVANDLLRKGVAFRADGSQKAGIRVVLMDEDLQIDLSDDAVTALLLRHLLPRFRAILEGIVG
jgi:V/A-type H+-transporting ATPase subunit E